MPTENERKYVLKLGAEQIFKKYSKNKHRIHQGYLLSSKGMVLRLRKFLIKNGFGRKKWEFYLTLKSNIKNRVVEIENEIDKRDFDDLWSVCLNKFEKVRYFCPDKCGQIWEVDFFKDHNGKSYFCLAELEMPEGQKEPKHIPNFIKNNLLYTVPLTSCEFSSKLLACPKYAIEMYDLCMKKNCKN